MSGRSEHRAVGGIEHDPEKSLFHGMCALCADGDWPCAAERELQIARLAAISEASLDGVRERVEEALRPWHGVRDTKFLIQAVRDAIASNTDTSPFPVDGNMQVNKRLAGLKQTSSEVNDVI